MSMKTVNCRWMRWTGSLPRKEDTKLHILALLIIENKIYRYP